MGRLQLFKKWINMLSGKSVFHMKQVAGRNYSKDSVKGYYSDMRHKVTGDIIIDEDGVPINITSQGEKIYFSITIFQYGLGAYDLYLETKNKDFLDNFFKSANWALVKQEESGAWDAFGWRKPNAKYSSMAQGEGSSLLVRAFLHNGDKKYLDAAKKAIDFMLIPMNEGGTTLYYPDGGLTFEEKKYSTTILNGAIFSIWGLWDYYLVSKEEKYKVIVETAVKYLCIKLPEFDCRYWSRYDLDGNIASPFYHDLHIEQLEVMFDLFECQEFYEYKNKWLKYQKSLIKSKKSFIVKAYQKVKSIDEGVDLVK